MSTNQTAVPPSRRSVQPRVLRIADLDEMLRVSKRTIYNWVADGHFPKSDVELGSHLRVAYADRGSRILLKASWCKGGRARWVPVRSYEQRALLHELRGFAGERSLIPQGLDYVQQKCGSRRRPQRPVSAGRTACATPTGSVVRDARGLPVSGEGRSRVAGSDARAAVARRDGPAHRVDGSSDTVAWT